MKRFIALAVFAIAMSSAWAQTQFQVATGECTKDNCSTYVAMFRELKGRCGEIPDLQLMELQSKGSVESVDRLLNNEIKAAVVQTDVLFWRKRTEDLTNIKTLVALHPEEAHFVSKVNNGIKTGGVGFGALKVNQDDLVLDKIEQLVGYKVGAVNGSGSLVTAKLIRAESNINYEVVAFDSTDKLLAALNANQIQAAVFVGGAPLPAVAALDQNYKLLSFSPTTQEALKDIYKPATLNYSKMNAAGVKSVATQANLVVREYKTPKMITALSALRTCFVDSLDEIKETTGTHKKWQAVQVDDHGKWPWYELPVAAKKK